MQRMRRVMDRRWALKMERWRTKEGAPFSAALKDEESITQEVLAVNVYLGVHSNDWGRCCKDAVCRFVDGNPHPKKRRARHSTASLKWIFLHPTTRLRGARGSCPVTAFIRPATM